MGGRVQTAQALLNGKTEDLSMWKDCDIHTTKEEIIKKANGSTHGGFVNVDGAWCATRNAEEFKEMLEHFFGFEISSCKETSYSTAVAITKCGLAIAWNGNCEMTLGN